MSKFPALAAMLILSAPLAAQEPTRETVELPQERMAGIAATLERIAVALEAQLEGSRLEMLMKRIEHSERRLQPQEARLRQALAERSGLALEKKRSEALLREFADRIEYGLNEMPEAEVEMTKRHYEFQAQQTEAKIENLDQRILALENQVAAGRRELEEWQLYVDRRLGGL